MAPLKSATASSRAAAPSSADVRHEIAGIAKRECWGDSVARSLSLLSRLGATRPCCSLAARRLSASVGLGDLGGRGLEQRRTSAALVSQAGSGAENVAARVSAATGDGARGSVALCRQTETCHSADGFDWLEKKEWQHGLWLPHRIWACTSCSSSRSAAAADLFRARLGLGCLRRVGVFCGGRGSCWDSGLGQEWDAATDQKAWSYALLE